MTMYDRAQPLATAHTPAPENWFEAWRRQGLYLRYAIATTLIAGMYLHVTSLFIGRDLLLQHVLTPAFDMALAVPMTYGGIVSWIVWKRVVHPGRWHRVVYGFLAIYFTISIPIHVQTFFTQRADYIMAFPAWYSYFLLPVLVGLLIFAVRLQFSANAGAGTPHRAGK